MDIRSLGEKQHSTCTWTATQYLRAETIKHVWITDVENVVSFQKLFRLPPQSVL